MGLTAYKLSSTDPWSISHLISGRPWCTGKQLPLGLSEMDLGSGVKLLSKPA